MATQTKNGNNSSPWSKGYDPNYERYYYYNYEIGVSQWEVPEGFVEENEMINNNRLSRSFQSLRENFEAQYEQEINMKRRSGLAIHLTQIFRTPDSDDESDADSNPDVGRQNINGNGNGTSPQSIQNNTVQAATATSTTATIDGEDDPKEWSPTRIRAYENWNKLILKILHQNANWDSVTFAIHLAAVQPLPPSSLSSPTHPPPPPPKSSSQRKQTPSISHLTVAKNKSLFLQEVLAARNRLFLSRIEKSNMPTMHHTPTLTISTSISSMNEEDDDIPLERATLFLPNHHQQLEELQKWSDQKNQQQIQQQQIQSQQQSQSHSQSQQRYEETKPYTPPTLLELHEQYDVLGGMNVDLSLEHASISTYSRQHSSKSIDNTTTDSNQLPTHPLLKSLNKLINVLNEFIFTEKTFVNDMNKLLLLLAELRYSTLHRVREFSSSAAFTGIYFATETINLINSQFLQSMLNSKPADDVFFNDSGRMSTRISRSNSLSAPSSAPPPLPSPTLSTNTPNNTPNNTPISISIPRPTSTSLQSPVPATFTDIKHCFDYATKYCENIFQSLQHFAPLFRLFSQFIVTHDSLSLLYSTLSFEDPEFNALLTQYEKLLGESLLSLIIKPVQRLPRYVLLCKEIHHTLTKVFLVCQDLKSKDSNSTSTAFLSGSSSSTSLATSSSSSTTLQFEIGEKEDEFITQLEKKAREVHNIIAECAKQCNNTVRTHQDNKLMQQLYDMFLEGGTHIPIVKNDRAIIKEGELKRHHRHGGMKSHEIQIFSDILLSSTPSGKGLKLEQIFSLGRGTDTLCLPIPSRNAGDPESNWFVLVSDDKMLFYCAKSHQEMLRWVEALHDCLIKNKADSDMYLTKNQIALVNTLIGEINRRRKDLVASSAAASAFSGSSSTGSGSGSAGGMSHHRQSVRQRSSSYERSFIETTNSIQASWWHLLDILEELCIQLKEEHTIQHLRRVIEHHCKEVVSRLILTISCPEEETRKGSNIIQTLLFNDSIHYIISIGVFFSYSTTTIASINEGERPQIIKLFLLSDVLIGTVLETVKDNLTYLFHIKLEHLQCSDYRDGVSDYAIQLIDLSSAVVKRRLSLSFTRSNQSDYTKYILYASTIDMKFDWLSLMMQAVEGYKHFQQQKITISSPIGTILSDSKKENYSMEYLKQIPLQRIESNLLRCSWVAETKALPADMI